MLLRRLFEHFKDQNWIAIALDLVVVVVGIFLAFQVDRWYTDQLLRDEVRQRLTQVLEDFHYNKQEIDRSISIRETVIAAAQELLEMEQNDPQEIDAEDFYRLLGAASTTFTPRLSRGAYDGLIATGEVDLIEDLDLRKSLTEFHALMDEIYVFNQGVWLVDRNTFEPYVIQNLDHIAMLQYVHPADENGSYGIVQNRPNQGDDAFRNVLGSPEFEGILGAKWHAIRDEIVRLQRLKEPIADIEDRILASVDRL